MGEVSSPYSLSRIQKYLTILESDLNQTTVVLLFYAYDSNSQNLELWLIDHKGIKAKGQTKVLTDSLDVMYDQLLASLHLKAERGDRGAKVNGLNTSSLRDPMAFWEEVLFPGETAMAIHDYRHLLISPVKNLGMLPWYALKAPGTENARIIDYWDLEILESLSHFALLGKYESVYSHRFDTFSFNPVSPLIVCTPDYSACKENSLPGAWEEASMVGARLGVPVRTGAKAKPSELFKTDVWDRPYFEGDFIYIAAHAVSSSENPLDESYILLSKYPEKGCLRWIARDIMGVRKQPESFVILSACQTGKGKSHPAGVVGLSRSFLLNPTMYTYYDDHPYYGAQNVVMSLWNVSDSATVGLMRCFLESLSKPLPFFPSSHLREAILAYRKTDPNPIHWASFQIMGVPYPLWMNMYLKTKD